MYTASVRTSQRTVYLHYKDRSVNSVYRNRCCFEINMKSVGHIYIPCQNVGFSAKPCSTCTDHTASNATCCKGGTVAILRFVQTI
jgi:hypothetical protein